MSCPDCFRGGIHNHKGDAKGQEEQLHGFRTYVTNPSSQSGSKSTIIFLCDAFGLDLINNKILADRYAEGTGFRVLVPDVIPGGPASIGLMDPMDQAFDPVRWWDVWGQLKRAMNIFTMVRILGLFYIRAIPSRASTYNPILEWARTVKRDLPSDAKLGVCGFCWGGYPSTRLCTEPSVAGGDVRLIDAQFCAHPSALEVPGMIVDAVTKFNVPYSAALGTKDFVLTPKQAEETEAVLRQKAGNGEGQNGYNYELKSHEGCQHGFAVRARPGDTVQEKGADDACEQAVAWFKKWL